MIKELDKLCDYRRYCWNLGLETWNEMYESHLLDKDNNPSPSEYKVRDYLVAKKSVLNIITSLFLKYPQSYMEIENIQDI